jgi:hypothetical protein
VWLEGLGQLKHPIVFIISSRILVQKINLTIKREHIGAIIIQRNPVSNYYELQPQANAEVPSTAMHLILYINSPPFSSTLTCTERIRATS